MGFIQSLFIKVMIIMILTQHLFISFDFLLFLKHPFSHSSNIPMLSNAFIILCNDPVLVFVSLDKSFIDIDLSNKSGIFNLAAT